MSRVWGRLSTLAADEQGQALTEYILILSACVVAAGAMTKQLLRVLDQGILKLGGQLEKDLKTGRPNVGIWKN
jgi:hypothetical protein